MLFSPRNIWQLVFTFTCECVHRSTSHLLNGESSFCLIMHESSVCRRPLPYEASGGDAWFAAPVLNVRPRCRKVRITMIMLMSHYIHIHIHVILFLFFYCYFFLQVKYNDDNAYVALYSYIIAVFFTHYFVCVLSS